jgi:hypothetical protein
VRSVFSSSANMLAKSTVQSPWLVGFCAEVGRILSVMALRAAPRWGSSFPQAAESLTLLRRVSLLRRKKVHSSRPCSGPKKVVSMRMGGPYGCSPWVVRRG